jgi:hypothetical protein
VCDSTLSILLDDVNDEPAAVLTLPKAWRGETATLELPHTITGMHDVYFLFSAPACRFRSFCFA